MIYLHEVWLNGAHEPQRFRLDCDDLFQAYQRWMQNDAPSTERGIVFSYTEKETTRTIALSFSGIACLSLEKLDEPNERRSMGFGMRLA
jgi:hypothetical protein